MQAHPVILGIIDRIIEREGGYSDHPSDAGGPTKYGITERTARAYGYTGHMRDLPRDTAVKIYLDQFFYQPGFQNILPISEAVAAELTDTEVNLRPRQAGRFLQRALNALNRQQRDYPDLMVDGLVGPSTARALKAFLSVRGPDGEVILLEAMNCQQGVYYIERCEAREANEDFFYGWLRHRVLEPAL